MPGPQVPTGTRAIRDPFVLAIILNSGLIPSGAANGSPAVLPRPGCFGRSGRVGRPRWIPSPGRLGPGEAPADVTVTAQDIKFDTATMAATADKRHLEIINKDDGIPHDIEIDERWADRLQGATIKSVSDTVYSVPPLKAGTYKFECKWHPTMVGALTAQ